MKDKINTAVFIVFVLCALCAFIGPIGIILSVLEITEYGVMNIMLMFMFIGISVTTLMTFLIAWKMYSGNLIGGKA